MHFTLNQKSVEVPDTQKPFRLLWVLRDYFGLIGPKFGCGIGVCGACSVHVEGSVVRSCSVSLSDVEGQSVTTLEGLATDGSLHPVQSAWIEHNVPQCGYCQNGQIMTAVSLVDSKKSHTDAEISSVMDSVRCRCGTQGRVKKALNQVIHSTREG